MPGIRLNPLPPEASIAALRISPRRFPWQAPAISFLVESQCRKASRPVPTVSPGRLQLPPAAGVRPSRRRLSRLQVACGSCPIQHPCHQKKLRSFADHMRLPLRSRYPCSVRRGSDWMCFDLSRLSRGCC
jgi:hypothetical protein